MTQTVKGKYWKMT